MKISNPKTGEVVVNDWCDGRCYCHHMAMIHGNDPNRCAECGCPKTLAGFEAFKAKARAWVPASPPPEESPR